MYSIVYFSPTGNVLHLANKLSAHLGHSNTIIQPLEFTEPSQLKKNTHLVLLYPVHGFNAPRTVKRFVNKLSPELFDYVSLIGVGCTTSWLNDAVSLDLRKALKKNNYQIIVDEILAMPLTFIMSFPDKVAVKLITESEEKIKDISLDITELRKSINDLKPKSQLVNFVGKAEQSAARLFGLELYADNNCISCGNCWNNCPEKNIKRNNKGKPSFSLNCLMCMRCIYNCSQKSISPRISKFIPIKKGYSFNYYQSLEKSKCQ